MRAYEVYYLVLSKAVLTTQISGAVLRLGGEETFTFARSALPFLSKHRISTATGPGLASWVGGTSLVPGLAAGGWRWDGPSAPAAASEQRRIAAAAAPRCTGWHKWCCATGRCFPLRKSATGPFSTWYGPAPVSLAKHVQHVLEECTTR